MVVCRYFLEGRCRYGESCFNEHPRGGGGGGGRGGGSRVTFRDSFGTASNPQTQNPYRWLASPAQQGGAQSTSAASAEDLVRNFPKEIEIWQMSQMWPFSCISIEKDIPSLPDFPDISPEELRFDAYRAIQQGSIETYKMKVSQLLQEYKHKQEQLKSMSPALHQKLVEMVEEGRHKKVADEGGSMLKPSAFGGQSGGFGSSAGSTSTFGSSSSASSSTFGNAGLFQGSTFGGSSGGFTQASAGASSIFGGTSAAAAGMSTFGQPASGAGGGLFGKAATTAPSTAAGSSTFGQPSLGAGLFGKGASGSAGGGSIFGQNVSSGRVFSQTSATGSGGFGQAQSSGFGQNAPAGSIFVQAASSSSTTSIFGQQSASSVTMPAPGLFGSAAQSASNTSSVFGGGGQSTGSVFGQTSTFPTSGASVGGLAGAAPMRSAQGLGFGPATAQQTQQATESSVYTPLDQLTAEEKTQFEALSFTLGMIPMRPPPKELINR